MNEDDLLVLRELTTRAVGVVQALQHVAQFGAVNGDGEDVEALRTQLIELRADIGRITRVIQDREARSWGRQDHPQHNDPPPRLAPPATNATPQPPVHVQKFDLQGAPAAEVKGRIPIMGQWAQRWTTRRRNEKAIRKASPWSLAKFASGRMEES